MARLRNPNQNSILRRTRRLVLAFIRKMTRRPYPSKVRPRLRVRLRQDSV
jgi:hypothetical protein